MRRVAVLRSCVALLALGLIGCGVDVSIQAVPNPAALGQPMNVSVTVNNTLECELTDTELVIFVISAQFADEAGELEELAQFCALVDDPIETCSLLDEEQSEIPGELVTFCCQVEAFRDENPGICTLATTDPPSSVTVRDAIIARARALGLPVDQASGGQVPAVTSGGLPINCMELFNGEMGAAFVCELDDLAAAATDVVTVSFTPTTPGQYYAFAFVDGLAECAGESFPGGTACVTATVGAIAPAPAVSVNGLIVISLGLMALGGFAIRTRRRT